MFQQNKSSLTETSHFDIIIAALHNKKKKSQLVQEEVSLKKLYQTMNTMVTGLDDSINSCKKYNEAKIHRKYQIILNDQSKRIRFLQQKIKEQHKARSPSKKYVQDLLDKLINYKFQNEALAKQNAELTQQASELKRKLQIYEDHVPTNQQKQDEKQKKKEQVTQNASTGQISGMFIQNQITSFLKIKSELRKHENIVKSKFQRFLKKIKEKSFGFSMRQFLQSIDKWVNEFTGQPEKSTTPLDNALPSQKINSTIYNNIGHRIAYPKAQIRSRKTFSFRSFVNPSSQEGILR